MIQINPLSFLSLSQSALHTQLKYLESLFDLPRSIKKRETAAATDSSLSSHSLTSLPKDHVEVFRLLAGHLNNAVVGSEFNWVRPSLWSSLFGAKDKKAAK